MNKLFSIFFCLFSFCCLSQVPIGISVSGRVIGQDPIDHLYQAMVVNNRSKTGTFANSDGTFSISALKTDTILFSAAGYTIRKLCFKDSVYKAVYNLEVQLRKLNINLNEVEVYPVKKLDEVQLSIEKLGVKNRSTYKNVDALSSPVTFLYERFSRFEQSKRKVAEMENEDRRKEVLKDLFRIYIKYEIINLSSEDFDQFIKYCNLSDDFIQNSTKYDLVTAIKSRYQQFEKRKPH